MIRQEYRTPNDPRSLSGGNRTDAGWPRGSAAIAPSWSDISSRLVRGAGWEFRASVLVLAAGAALWWACATYPAELPVIAPWDFSWLEYLGATFPVLWYLLGLHRTAPHRRPHPLRRLAFLAGVATIYAMLQTHFVYLSQHMFFLNRLQSVGIHHLGPFLIALSWPGETLAAGMPVRLRRALEAAFVGRVLRIVHTPVFTATLFVLLLCLWLIPPVHFQAMISPPLYTFMNLSMVVCGLLFWGFVLDPRPAPPARFSYLARMATSIVVIFPQIVIGATLSFEMTAFYTYYDLCGRLFLSIGALFDQHLGGVVVWIPSSMMSSIAFLLNLNRIRLHDERRGGGIGTDDIEIAPGIRISSKSWTGR